MTKNPVKKNVTTLKSYSTERIGCPIHNILLGESIHYDPNLGNKLSASIIVMAGYLSDSSVNVLFFSPLVVCKPDLLCHIWDVATHLYIIST